MTFLTGLLPIFEKNDNPHPIALKTQDSIESELQQEAKLERLATYSINKPNAKEYFLEPIPHELFDIFQAEESMEVTTRSLDLMRVGSLSIMDDDDDAAATVDNSPLLTLDLEAYKERRKKIDQDLNPSAIGYSPAPTTPALSVDMPNRMNGNIEQTQYFNDILEQVLNEDHVMEEHTAINVTTRAIPARTMPAPVTITQSPLIVRPPPSTNGQSVTINVQPSIHIQTPQPIIVRQPVVQVQAQQAIVQAQQAPSAVQPPSVQQPSVQQPSNQQLSVQSPPSAAVAQPVVAQPVVVQPTQPAIVQEQLEPELIAELPEIDANSRWYDDHELTTENLDMLTGNSHHLYSYPPLMIPIFATQNQRRECDQLTEAMTRNRANTQPRFESSISCLNFPTSNFDVTLNEQWAQSGKSIFLKSLLSRLMNLGKTIIIVTKGLSDEEALMDLLTKSLMMEAERLNYMLDEDWDGEYGVCIKTISKTGQIISFPREADLMMFLDVRVKHTIVDKIRKINSPNMVPPPVASLVSLGSIEERVFNYLNQSPEHSARDKSEEFKELMRTRNTWPDGDHHQMNEMVANNLLSWLLHYDAPYQFRSVTNLPQTTRFAKTIQGDVTEETISTDLAQTTITEEEALEETPIETPVEAPVQLLVHSPAITTSTEEVPAVPAIHEAPAAVPTAQQPITEKSAAEQATNTTAEPNTSGLTTITELPRVPMVVAEETNSDMEIESEDDATPTIITPFVITEKLKTYVNDTLFPAFDMETRQLPAITGKSEALLRLSDADRKLIAKAPIGVADNYKEHVNSINEEYKLELNALKRRYDAAFSEARQEYKEALFAAIKK